MNCEFCKKTFTNKANLRRHQETVVACLKLQGKSLAKNICDYCNGSYTEKSSLNRHLLSCKTKRESDIKENLDDAKAKYCKKISKLRTYYETENVEFLETVKNLTTENAKLKRMIKEKDKEIIALKIKCESNNGKIEVYDKVCNKAMDKSTISNTSVSTNTSVTSMYVHPKLVNIPINNIHPLTIEYIKDKVDNGGYTLDHYLRGEQGLADFIYSLTTCENADGILEMNYACTDLTRDSYHRLVETKEWKKDKGGKYMDVIFDSISGQVNTYHMDMFVKRTDKNFKPSLSFDPDYIFKFNTDMHAGIVQTSGKERRALVQRMKKETSRKICV